MVTKPAPPGRRRRKKGRPSLLDLQRRTLRLEKLHQQRSSPSPNRDPDPHSSRRSTSRSPNPASSSDDEDEGRAREKKLRLVLDAEAHTHEGGRQDSDKATIGSPEDLGSTTPLPDKKLLVFILDRLQKKDTYGVFSEPVDPEELPDYHDIIEHPMDFGTVRKKLSTGAYRNLEQFEKDVFLISSNAMCYNAPDTIYYRQARSIQELARKNFENLRQESDDNEPEPKTLPRRGRPPSKTIAKRTVGIPPTVCSSLECSSNPRIAKGGEGTHLSNFNNTLSRKVTPDMSTKVNHSLCSAELSSWMAEHMPEKNEEYTGSGQKKNLIKYGKEPPVTENCRSMYNQSKPSACFLEDPLLTAFGKEKNPLLPIGLHVDYSYARSLARFAAKLGPIAWEIAAKKIERALPPGTKFGPGWIGESEDSKSFQAALLTTTHPVHPSHTETSPFTTEERVVKLAQSPEVASNDVAVEEGHSCSVLQQPSSFAASNSSCSRLEDIDNARVSSYESRISPPSDAGSSNFQTNSQLHLNTRLHSSGSSFNPALEFYVASQLGRIVTPGTTLGSFGPDVPMTHAQALDMVSRSSNSLIHRAAMSHMDAEREMLERSSSYQNDDIPMVAPVSESKEPLQLSFHQKRESVPSDLNVRFHSSGSPLASSVVVESQQFDLALQL